MAERNGLSAIPQESRRNVKKLDWTHARVCRRIGRPARPRRRPPSRAPPAERPRSYDDSESFLFFLKALRAAQYSFMRADTARRFAGVMNGIPARSFGAGFLSFAGLVDVVCLDDSSEFAAVDGFVVIVLAAARFGCGVGAISMPNIPERSSLSSTFAPAGPLRVIERSDPAVAIKSC